MMVSNEIGCKAPRDARLVVLPNVQGIGLGPLMLRTNWNTLVASGNVLYAKTKLPCHQLLAKVWALFDM